LNICFVDLLKVFKRVFSCIKFFCSEDESLLTSTHATNAQQVTKQLTFQLARDGYQLDQTPDNDQIDLFPTKDFNHPPVCCQTTGFSCTISWQTARL